MAVFLLTNNVNEMKKMNIYVYSDESGVFDKKHNDYFVFGGIICLGTDNKLLWSRKYSAVEKVLRKECTKLKNQEIKACILDNKYKNQLYRSLNKCYKFGAVVQQDRVLDRIFHGKKDKQRYLDYVYKISIKNALSYLIDKKVISADSVEHIYFYADEHTTATNGRYELKEGLEKELKNGTYNYEYNYFFSPIFSNLKSVDLEFCNSASNLLVRAADIVANRFYYIATKKNCNFTYEIENRNSMIKMFP